MHRAAVDRFLPPDHEAFVAADPPTGRLIVIAPTRAACETIELAIGLHLDTFLERAHGDEIRELAGHRRGFGIVAGTGTGKTLAIRSMAEVILGAPQRATQASPLPPPPQRATQASPLPPPPQRATQASPLLRVGVVNREREATPETPTWNVVIVTTGIARRWFQDGDILPTDTLVVDEIHQTLAELELCLALGKRTGCRFILALRDGRSALLRALSQLVCGHRKLGIRSSQSGGGSRGAKGSAGIPRRPLSA